jgi:hypothetical protein
MNDLEWQDFERLMEILLLCKNAEDWGGPVSFERIWQTCADELDDLKLHIGDRIISKSMEKEK